MPPSAPSAPRVHDASALPVGTRLGEFELLSVLGVGGFGIVYLAFDHALEREVAVKEYMPASLAGRTETMHVSLRSQSDAETFALGLRSFVNEARLLARFDHPSLLKVLRFWEANGTAYMAMPVMRGRTLKELRTELGRAPDEATLRSLVDALLGALERLHGEGVYHRDIAPDNIQVEPDGHPVLLDFGAARRVLSDRTQTLTAILKPAYAPIEQYAETGSVKQGPWTDFYALGATLHYVLLGKPPAPATARAVFDESSALAGQGVPGCSLAFLQMVDWMLAPKPADRPQSVADLRQVLLGERQVPLPFQIEPDSTAWDRTQVLPRGLTGGDDSTLVMPRTQPLSGADAASAGFAGTVAPAVAMSTPTTATAALPRTHPTEVPALTGEPTNGPRQQQALVAPAPAVALAAALAPSPGETSPAAHGPVAMPATPARKSVWPMAAAGLAALLVAGFVFWPKPSAPPAVAQPLATTGPGTAAQLPVAGAGAAGVLAQPGAASAALPTASAPIAGATPAAAAVPPVPTPAAAASAATPVARAVPESEIKPAIPAVARPAPRTAPGAAGANKPATPTPQTPALNDTPVAATPAAPAAVTAASPTAQPAAASPPAAAPAAAPRPAAAETPPAAAAVGAGPESKCSGRNPVMYFVCMERECLRSSFLGHADCQAWRKDAKRE